jgi:hypothetical protein
VAALVFLIIGVVCSIISRVLLFRAALNLGVAWAVGVLLPFGPLLFWFNYPAEAHRSRMVRLASLPCFFLYIVLGPAPAFRHHLATQEISARPVSYGIENGGGSKKAAAKGPGPTVELTPSTDEQRASNTRDFEHLRVWGETLRLKKRDLLHSDGPGNQAYEAELAEYNAALQNATAERAELWPGTK